MTQITKAQWAKLEEKMTNSFVSVRFKYKGYELSIQRLRIAESKTALAVYIDDVAKQSWGIFDSAFVKEPEDRPSIIKDVWKRRTMGRYKPAQIKKLEKLFGKRRVKKEIPDLHDRITWYEWLFPKASVLCRQFKKLEGLELVMDSDFIEGDA